MSTTVDRTNDHRRTAMIAILAIVTLAALIVGVLNALHLIDDNQSETRRTAAVRVAEAQSLTLLGITESNVDERMQQLLSNSTGDFRRQLEGIESTFGSVVKKGKVRSTGSIVSSGVVKLSDTKARVLLALTSEVTNEQTKGPEKRPYRVTVDMTWKDDKWLVSAMQFAP